MNIASGRWYIYPFIGPAFLTAVSAFILFVVAPSPQELETMPIVKPLFTQVEPLLYLVMSVGLIWAGVMLLLQALVEMGVVSGSCYRCAGFVRDLFNSRRYNKKCMLCGYRQ